MNAVNIIKAFIFAFFFLLFTFQADEFLRQIYCSETESSVSVSKEYFYTFIILFHSISFNSIDANFIIIIAVVYLTKSSTFIPYRN